MIEFVHFLLNVSLYTAKKKKLGRKVPSNFYFLDLHFRFRITVDGSSADLVRPLLNEAGLKSFADFDNHLDDVSNDWRNPNLFRSAEIDKVK